MNSKTLDDLDQSLYFIREKLSLLKKEVDERATLLGFYAALAMPLPCLFSRLWYDGLLTFISLMCRDEEQQIYVWTSKGSN
jgi:hypothetical protein